jgi:hypothetical protein
MRETVSVEDLNLSQQLMEAVKHTANVKEPGLHGRRHRTLCRHKGSAVARPAAQNALATERFVGTERRFLFLVDTRVDI